MATLVFILIGDGQRRRDHIGERQSLAPRHSLTDILRRTLSPQGPAPCGPWTHSSFAAIRVRARTGSSTTAWVTPTHPITTVVASSWGSARGISGRSFGRSTAPRTAWSHLGIGIRPPTEISAQMSAPCSSTRAATKGFTSSRCTFWPHVVTAAQARYRGSKVGPTVAQFVIVLEEFVAQVPAPCGSSAQPQGDSHLLGARSGLRKPVRSFAVHSAPDFFRKAHRFALLGPGVHRHLPAQDAQGHEQQLCEQDRHWQPS